MAIFDKAGKRKNVTDFKFKLEDYMNKFIFKKIKIILTTGSFAIKINIHLLQLIILIMVLVSYFLT